MAWEKFEYAKTDTVMPAYILITDELAQFVEDLPREDQRKADEFQANIQKIARLGRASHIHVILATQSCTGNMFPPSLKNNIAFRNVCGRVEANISRTAIDSEEGESIPLTPGAYLGYAKGETQNYQGYFTKTSEVLALGTVKPGYDPHTGLAEEGGDTFDLSPLEDTDESEEEEDLSQEVGEFEGLDDFLSEDSNDESTEEDDFILKRTSDNEFTIGDESDNDGFDLSDDFLLDDDIPELELPDSNGLNMDISVDIPENTPAVKIKGKNGSTIKLNLNKKAPDTRQSSSNNSGIIGADQPSRQPRANSSGKSSSGIITIT